VTDEAWGAYLDASAAALELPIAADHRPGVLRFLALAAGFAAQLDAVPLAPHDEPAVNFLPPA
jgi:hypothetical protein